MRRSPNAVIPECLNRESSRRQWMGYSLDSRTGTASTSRHNVYYGAGRLRGNDVLKRISLLILLSLLGCAHTRLKLGKFADGEVVEAEGLAPYNTKDMIATKRASLVDAQKNAVEKAVGVFVSGKTLVEKAVAIENNILARTDGYIKKYDVINEGPEADLYKTRIRALVALKDLEKDLKQMSLLGTEELNRPRVTITIDEKVEKESVNDHPAGTALQKTLTDAGYIIITGEKGEKPDLQVTGTATSYPFQSEGLGGFVSYRARLSLQAVRPGTTNIVYAVSKEASGLGGNKELAGLKSLETVGNLVGTEMATQLAQVWSNKKTISVSVEGVKSFSDVERVRKHLLSQPGVKDLVIRLYDEDMAQFEVQLGDEKTAELAAHLEASQSLPLSVVEATSQTLRLKTK